MKEKKLQKWLFEILKPFVEIDLLKFDPFGNTLSTFPYNKICDFLKLESFGQIKNVQTEIDQELMKNFEEFIETFWENVIKLLVFIRKFNRSFLKNSLKL